MKFDKILLFSGGVDSYIAYYWLNKPQTLYFNLKNRYSKRELQVVKKLIPSTIIDESLNIGDREVGEKAYIPFRNLLLACLANKYSDNIYIIGIEDDVVSDKNEQIFLEFSELLSKLEGRKINVLSPFWNMSKVELIKWYLDNSFPVENLYQTISCYDSAEQSNYCGKCPSCFRKWVGFQLNGLDLPFYNDDLVVDYYNRALQGVYSHKRNKNIIEAVSRRKEG